MTSTIGNTELTTAGDREIRFERIFDAPRDAVWHAFTQPDLIAKWWGRGHEVDVEQHDLRPGGHWRYVEHTDHGDEGFEGRFREVRAPEFIAETFEYDGMPGYPSVQTATFTPVGEGQTKLEATVLFMTPEERAGMLQSGMEGGMNESYAALDRLLASMR
jgi:uncharacterized protein YndB with AHSA1/START domain